MGGVVEANFEESEAAESPFLCYTLKLNYNAPEVNLIFILTKAMKTNHAAPFPAAAAGIRFEDLVCGVGQSQQGAIMCPSILGGLCMQEPTLN